MTTSTTLTPAPTDAPDAEAAAPAADQAAADAAALLAAISARGAVASLVVADAAAPPVGPPKAIPKPPRLFPYVDNSEPAELAANIDRAIQAIAAAPGGLGSEQSMLGLRYLCSSLIRFVSSCPTEERVAAFWGVFPALVAFVRQLGESLPEPPGAISDLGLDEVFDSPVGQLGLVLFAAHRRLGKEGSGFDAELLECLELALESFDDSEGACWGKGAVLGVMAYHAPLLFAIDSAWTHKHLLAHLVAGDAYRQVTAKLLVVFTEGSTEKFLDEVWPYVLGLCEDLEVVFGDDFGSRSWELRRLHLFAERAFEHNDEQTIAQIAGVLRVMPATDRGKFIHALHRPFDDLTGYYEELSDRELHEILGDRLRTPELIRTFWPAEPQYQSEWTTTCFIDLIFDAGEHAGDIFEVCRDFLVPLTNERYQYWTYYDLVRKPKYRDFVQANPAVMVGIIDRTTNEHSSYLTELTELKYHLLSKTPPPPAAAS